MIQPIKLILVSRTQCVIVPLFCLTAGALLVTAVITTRIDPTDQSEQKLKGVAKNGVINPNEWRFCKICQRNIGKKTKHCRRDNRCCLEFDHHCLWINNCIGRKNYFWFVSMVFFALLFCGTKFILTIAGLSISFKDQEFLRSSFENVMICLYYFIAALAGQLYPFFNRTALLGTTIIQLLLDFVFFSFLAELFFLHVFLLIKGKSTYEFIMEKRRKRAGAKTEKKKPSILDDAVFPPKEEALFDQNDSCTFTL